MTLRYVSLVVSHFIGQILIGCSVFLEMSVGKPPQICDFKRVHDKSDILIQLGFPVQIFGPIKMHLNVIYNKDRVCNYRQSHWPRDLRRGFAAARLMVFRVRIPPGVMNVCIL